MRGRGLGAVLCLAAALQPAAFTPFALGAGGYLRQYQLGFDYKNSYDHVAVTYETARDGTPARGCAEVAGDPVRQRCEVDMTGGRSSGLGLVLQQAFRRQGTWHFQPDFSFGLRYLGGSLPDDTRRESEQAGLPLRSLSFSLAALVFKPYLQVGYTPARLWPDLLFSLGPSAQIAVGKVAVNGDQETVAVATTSDSLISGFIEFEVVPVRFGEGAFSLFLASDWTGEGRGTRLYPHDVDGMRDFRAAFGRNVKGDWWGFGLKLITTWP